MSETKTLSDAAVWGLRRSNFTFLSGVRYTLNRLHCFFFSGVKVRPKPPHIRICARTLQGCGASTKPRFFSEAQRLHAVSEGLCFWHGTKGVQGVGLSGV